MNKLFLGSIDLSKINKNDVVTTDKNGQEFSNGAKYLNISIWLNDKPDNYGNTISIKTGGKENSYFLGNAKEYDKTNQNKTLIKNDDLPF